MDLRAVLVKLADAPDAAALGGLGGAALGAYYGPEILDELTARQIAQNAVRGVSLPLPLGRAGARLADALNVPIDGPGGQQIGYADARQLAGRGGGALLGGLLGYAAGRIVQPRRRVRK